MARRFIYIPTAATTGWVTGLSLEFTWYPGFSVSQARRSIASLHAAAMQAGVQPVLEISTKSDTAIGQQLSALQLRLSLAGQLMPVECAYQGSKVFGGGGPYQDLYELTGREAKTDRRLRDSGDLKGFQTPEGTYPLKPETAFYDWLYIRGLLHNPSLSQHLKKYFAFSDIAFNPARSVSTQAHSAALYLALVRAGFVDMQRLVKDWAYYVRVISAAVPSGGASYSLKQPQLPGI